MALGLCILPITSKGQCMAARVPHKCMYVYALEDYTASVCTPAHVGPLEGRIS